MADELKRVGLIFKSDGNADFVKTLKEINLEMNKNYNQFKLTQSQWDNSTKSTKKLRQEQEYLKNAYEIQNDKVTALKMQLEELENSENKNTTAIKKKRNELTSAEVKLESYNKKIKDIENQLHNTGKKIEEFGNKVKESGKKIEEAGKKLSAFSMATLGALTASAKGAIEFESAFTGVEKTVDGTSEQMESLKQGIRDMAKEIPSSTTEISAVAEAAGQLGIKTDNILSFSKAMIDLGNSTNLSASEAASQLAKFANITEMSQKDFDRLGSSIVDLGNNFATTEADIVNMAMRLAGAGHQVGLSEGEILGLATALSSVGIEAEMGGSAISKAMVKMQNAVEMGGKKLDIVLQQTGMSLRDLELMAANDSKGFKDMSQSIGMTSTEVKQLITAGSNLEDFARIAGMSADDFKKAWKEDAVGALTAFIQGLGNAEDKGESAITMLSEMGLTEVRLRDSLLRAANAGDLLNNAIEMGTKSWKENNALSKEANKRYETLQSKMKVALNKIKDMGITIGNKLMPAIEKVVDKVGKWTDAFSKLDDKQVEAIVKIGLVVAAIGPLLTILGKITSTVGGVVSGIGTFVQAIGVMRGTITTASTSVTSLASVLSAITSPVGIAIGATTALTAVLIDAQRKIGKNIIKEKERTEEIRNQKKALEELKNQQKENLDSNLAEIDNIKKLKNELSTLVDENGKVKKGYEGRVSFILNELNNALGTEYKLNGKVIDSYKEIKGSIDEVIEKKKANIILNTQEEAYKNAIENQAKETQKLGEIQADLNKKIKERNDIAKEYAEKRKTNDFGPWEADSLSRRKDILNKEVKALQASYYEQESIVQMYYEDIAKYETNAALIQEGSTESIKKVNDSVVSSYSNRKEKTIESLKKSLNTEIAVLNTSEKTYEKNQNKITQKQIEESKKRLKGLVEELLSNTNTVEENTPEIVQAWNDLANGSYSVYSETVAKLPLELRERIQDMTGVVVNEKTSLINETQVMSQDVLNRMSKSKEFKSKALENLQSYLKGLKDEDLRSLLKSAGIENVEAVINGIRKREFS